MVCSKDLVHPMRTLAFMLVLILLPHPTPLNATTKSSGLLTDPFLQLPTRDGVHVVWFTEWQGVSHVVTYGSDRNHVVAATSTKLSRTAEDAKSYHNSDIKHERPTTPRDIWRHEAHVRGLQSAVRVPYYVSSTKENGKIITSGEYTLQSLPLPGQPLKILLTSDHQLKPGTTANLEMVEKTIGRIDGVFFAGDLVHIPDRASEWFDDSRGLAFFPNLQGNGRYSFTQAMITDGGSSTTSKTYMGGELIQHAPLFPVIGNHEVMGRYSRNYNLYDQFIDAQPKSVASKGYKLVAGVENPKGLEMISEGWIENNSFNTITYEEIFTLPDNGPAGEQYYSIQFGDVYLIGLFSTRIWRHPKPSDGKPGKYYEAPAMLNTPEKWGYGDFIFEDVSKESKQYAWLAKQLTGKAFRDAKFRIVLMHQAPHGVGLNYIPVFAHPEHIFDKDDSGNITNIRYEYPIERDILINDVQPLLEQAGVDLVHSGHSHLWFRMKKDGVNYLETSNVGSNFGCYIEGNSDRDNVPTNKKYNGANYVKFGDPHGLAPLQPSLFSPRKDANGMNLPCVASDQLTVFTILDTSNGTLNSYVYDLSTPKVKPRLFDIFKIGR